MHCHLFVPDFFSVDAAPPADRFAALETLAARGRRTAPDALSAHAWLFGQFGVGRQHDWPVAPYALLGEGGAPGDDGWLRADPVQLRAASEGLALVEAAPGDIRREEADALAATLNAHFGAGTLLAPSPARWYLRLPQPAEVETTPPSAALGPVSAHLPRGRDALRLHALMNEAQMLLHEHPVNAAREARDEAELNSLWLWGGGAFAPATARPFSAVFADDPLARGLALAAGIAVRPPPASAAALRAALPREGVVLLAANPPRDTDALEALERDGFAPLLAALKEGAIGMLSLHLFGDGRALEVETVRADLRRFWRRRKPLAELLR